MPIVAVDCQSQTIFYPLIQAWKNIQIDEQNKLLF